MDGSLLDIYGNYQDAKNAYDQDIQQYNKDVNTWNDLYYAGNYDAMRAMGQPVEPTAPIAPRAPTDTQTLGEVLPQDLYASVFGKGTPDTLTNEAWSLQNISTPFLSSAYDTAYDLGQINRMNNPLYYATPDLLTQGQQGYDPNQAINAASMYS